MTVNISRRSALVGVVVVAATMSLRVAAQQSPSVTALHAKVLTRLVIKNPMVIIDATGKYVTPGIVDTHMHWHEERQPGVPQPVVVNGNPLDNLRLLNPYDADVMLLNGKPVSNYTPIGPTDRVENVHAGGIEWTIKDGIPYHVPTLMDEVKDMVAKARAAALVGPRPDSEGR